MGIAIIGQQAFGNAVLEASLSRATGVAAVLCASAKPGANHDPWRELIPLSLLPKHRGPSAINWPVALGATETNNADGLFSIAE